MITSVPLYRPGGEALDEAVQEQVVCHADRMAMIRVGAGGGEQRLTEEDVAQDQCGGYADASVGDSERVM